MNMNKQSPSSTRQQPNVVGLFAKNNYYEVSLSFTCSINNAPKRDDTESGHVIYSKSLVKSSCLHYWECAIGRGCNEKANKCFTFVLFPVKVARIMLLDAVKGKSLALSHSPVIYDKI